MNIIIALVPVLNMPESIVLIICPLILLMKDQIHSLDSKGITATLVEQHPEVQSVS